MNANRSLDDRLDDGFAEAWKPEPGNKLIGIVTELDERENDYGTYPIVTVQTDDGQELAFHAFRTVARNELAKQRPKVGDRIGIKYEGKPPGKEYELYRVKVERVDEPQQTIDWSKHEADDAGPSAEEEQDPSRQEQRPDSAADDDIPF